MQLNEIFRWRPSPSIALPSLLPVKLPLISLLFGAPGHVTPSSCALEWLHHVQVHRHLHLDRSIYFFLFDLTILIEINLQIIDLQLFTFDLPSLKIVPLLLGPCHSGLNVLRS